VELTGHKLYQGFSGIWEHCIDLVSIVLLPINTPTAEKYSEDSLYSTFRYFHCCSRKLGGYSKKRSKKIYVYGETYAAWLIFLSTIREIQEMWAARLFSCWSILRPVMPLSSIKKYAVIGRANGQT
jgi:hypothetical protein